VRLIGYGDQRVPCLIYEHLTMETAAELSKGLQDRRNLHPLDKYRCDLAAHDRRAVEIAKVLEKLDIELVYSAKATDRARVSAVGALQHIWDLGGMTSLERVLLICGAAWDQTAAGFSSQIMRLVMTVITAHNGEVDDTHLARTLAIRSAPQWLAKDSIPRRPIASLAQDVILEYNKKMRGDKRLSEMTLGQYERAYKRRPAPTKRGKIDAGETGTTAPTTATPPSRRRRDVPEGG
jgi:hypothetical protein